MSLTRATGRFDVPCHGRVEVGDSAERLVLEHGSQRLQVAAILHAQIERIRPRESLPRPPTLHQIDPRAVRGPRIAEAVESSSALSKTMP